MALFRNVEEVADAYQKYEVAVFPNNLEEAKEIFSIYCDDITQAIKLGVGDEFYAKLDKVKFFFLSPFKGFFSEFPKEEALNADIAVIQDYLDLYDKFLDLQIILSDSLTATNYRDVSLFGDFSQMVFIEVNQAMDIRRKAIYYDIQLGYDQCYHRSAISDLEDVFWYLNDFYQMEKMNFGISKTKVKSK